MFCEKNISSRLFNHIHASRPEIEAYVEELSVKKEKNIFPFFIIYIYIWVRMHIQSALWRFILFPFIVFMKMFYSGYPLHNLKILNFLRMYTITRRVHTGIKRVSTSTLPPTRFYMTSTKKGCERIIFLQFYFTFTRIFRALPWVPTMTGKETTLS